MRQDSVEEIKEKVGHILRSAGVKRAAVFGSYARNEAQEKSDVDILVEFEGRKTLFDFIELEQKLEKELGRSVDLITYHSLSPLLHGRVLNEQIQIYG